MSAGEPRVLVVDDEPQIVRGLQGHPAQRGLPSRGGDHQAGGARRRLRPAPRCDRARPRAARTATGSRSPPRSGAGASCRSSCSRRWATSARRCARSTPAPTTTSPSRSAARSCSPGCGRCSGAAARTADSSSRGSATWRSTWPTARCGADGEEVHLTPIEFDLLSQLAQHPGRLVTHRQLLHEVWGPGYEDETHYLRVHFAHVRAKLEPDPSRSRAT